MRRSREMKAEKEEGWPGREVRLSTFEKLSFEGSR
jgi:hypothetical protein